MFWGGWSPRLLDSETPNSVWPQVVLDDLNPKRLSDGSKGYFRQSSDQIGVTATNDFIFGDLHHAMRSQLFDGLVAGGVTDAVDLANLPDHPAIANSDTPVTLADLASLLGIDRPILCPPGLNSYNSSRSSVIWRSSKRRSPCRVNPAMPDTFHSTNSAPCPC